MKVTFKLSLLFEKVSKKKKINTRPAIAPSLKILGTRILKLTEKSSFKLLLF